MGCAKDNGISAIKVINTFNIDSNTNYNCIYTTFVCITLKIESHEKNGILSKNNPFSHQRRPH